MTWKIVAALVFVLASLSFASIAVRVCWEEGYDNGFEAGKDQVLHDIGWTFTDEQGQPIADPLGD